MKTILYAAAALSDSLTTASAHDVAKPGLAYDTKDAKVTLVYEHPLPDVPGKSVKGVLVEYGPGGYSSAHTHAKSALIYATVLEGAIQSAVNGGETKTFIAGQIFTELPGDRHDVSANASKTEPAKLLAVFVVDTDDTALTTPRKP
ncbi:cupin domain-containing protein [Rhizobium bangladeshense]|uniref:cupin domain-containing protein n=1 Tax=Rhizobium bangladeshense TaxID=1138189 RepID=UPI001A99F2AC|nr:cupin domain-containing protein [Rhizobium bangladeshense]MBX4893016.1 cupin domain-containing protein [Rhizobium bangladeshense]MBX4917409.1 cupin domain-containing protein [Rhizobium bangladeshense]QSY97520.1 cupin domain-containing protein [Rhizobium bangladeshense]